ncbi:MAG: hypothetical protein KIT58_06985 [Planctomycetota bacterium]|nr:hypothetical protein [Planctomycetota bacterium]
MPALAIRVEAATTAQRCAVCHDDLSPGPGTRACPGCHTTVHTDCAREVRRCPTRGCSGRRAPVDVRRAVRRGLSQAVAARPWLIAVLVALACPFALLAAASGMNLAFLLALFRLDPLGAALPASVLVSPVATYFLVRRRSADPGPEVSIQASLVSLVAAAAWTSGLALTAAAL